MTAVIITIPSARSRSTIAVERAGSHQSKPSPRTYEEICRFAMEWQSKLYPQPTAPAEAGLLAAVSPSNAHEKFNHMPESFSDAHSRLNGVVSWLIEQGVSVLAYSLGGIGSPIVKIEFTVSAQQELCLIEVGSHTENGKVFKRLLTQRNGVKIWCKKFN